jgi:hypothetical protein
MPDNLGERRGRLQIRLKDQTGFQTIFVRGESLIIVHVRGPARIPDNL